MLLTQIAIAIGAFLLIALGYKKYLQWKHSGATILSFGLLAGLIFAGILAGNTFLYEMFGIKTLNTLVFHDAAKGGAWGSGMFTLIFVLGGGALVLSAVWNFLVNVARSRGLTSKPAVAMIITLLTVVAIPAIWVPFGAALWSRHIDLAGPTQDASAGVARSAAINTLTFVSNVTDQTRKSMVENSLRIPKSAKDMLDEEENRQLNKQSDDDGIPYQYPEHTSAVDKRRHDNNPDQDNINQDEYDPADFETAIEPTVTSEGDGNSPAFKEQRRNDRPLRYTSPDKQKNVRGPDDN